MSGSGPQRREDESSPRPGPPTVSPTAPPTGVIAAGVVVVSMLAIGFAVAVGLRLGGSYLGDTLSSGPLPTSTRTPVTRPDRTPRSTTDAARATTSPRSVSARRASATCSELRSLTAPGELAAGSRIVDCADGWAVLSSAHSGDPYWVAYRDGRWQPVSDISMYLLTCPDEAIAQGAPAWMAERHLGTCPDRHLRTSALRTFPTRAGAERTTPRPPGTSPPPASPPTSVVPTATGPARPTTSGTSPSSEQPSTPTSPLVSVPEETRMTTTPAAAAAEAVAASTPAAI